MKKNKKRKSNKNISLIFLFYLLVFITTLLIYKPNELDINSTESGEIITLDKNKKQEEFDFIVEFLKNDYPYLSINEKYINNTLDNIISNYENKLLETKSDVEYEKTLLDFFEEFKQPNLFLIDSKKYFTYKSQLEDNSDSPWSLVLNDKNVLARYSEYKDTSDDTSSESGISMEIINENKTAYIKIQDFNPLAIKKDSSLLTEFINGLDGYSHLIIDIRDNNGSSIEYLFENIITPLAHNTLVMNSVILEKNEKYSEFLDYYNSYSYFDLDDKFYKSNKISGKDISNDKLENFPLYKEYKIRIQENKDNLFDGEIYILQNKNTSNAADFLSQFSNITDFATTVGQFTSGNGINLNNAFIKLPYSNFVISTPIGMGINEEGSANTEYGTYPEIEIKENSDSLEVLLEMLD
ncbi:S41 family peptidase [Miniphocaeibacter massiliensis]|uniref:S41 family peptidase n=1 Tax=Miniphocaeibacter massiliensis TaxID=2041841 RepID=UPI000C1C0C29|nr:S41 family peptidase [Miniphocaeibacter massiliensis]